MAKVTPTAKSGNGNGGKAPTTQEASNASAQPATQTTAHAPATAAGTSGAPTTDDGATVELPGVPTTVEGAGATAEGGKKSRSGKRKKPNADNPEADAYGRLPYPGLFVHTKAEDGTITYEFAEDGSKKRAPKLTTVPEDFNGNVHRPLLKEDFETEAHYFEHKAELAEASAKKYRKMAEDSRKIGSSAEGKSVKKLLDMTRRLDALRKQLIAAGINPDELIAEDDSDSVPSDSRAPSTQQKNA